MLHIDSGSPAGLRLLADQPLKVGQVIWRFRDVRYTSHPTYQTIQVAPRRHITDLGAPAYLNHSCNPTTFVDTRRLIVVAARDIEPGEELTFFYPSTEWDMARPFRCLCGERECLKLIRGARHLSTAILSRYVISPHIRRMIAAELKRTEVAAPRIDHISWLNGAIPAPQLRCGPAT